MQPYSRPFLSRPCLSRYAILDPYPVPAAEREHVVDCYDVGSKIRNETWRNLISNRHLTDSSRKHVLTAHEANKLTNPEQSHF